MTFEKIFKSTVSGLPVQISKKEPDDFVRPADILHDGLRYVWRTNADPAQVMAIDSIVTYALEKPVVYENARIGPPSKHWPEGVGIYQRAP